jgi:undecaprenyl-diphosphatase
MELLDALILGVVQGITEFLPISSSGHLILVREWLHMSEVNALAFDAMLHFGTTIAVIIYFWNDLWVLLQAVLRKLSRLPVNEKDMILFYALVVGTLPAAFFGFFLEPYFSKFETSVVVASFLFIASILFIFVEWRYYLKPPQGALTIKRGLLVGFFQALALFPGMSRSGSTIAGGMLLGMTRYEASRFSFLLAIPITLAAGSKKLLDLISLHETVDWTPILLGTATATIVAFIVIHFFLTFIRRYTLWPFIWYGLLLSGFILYAALVG